MPRKRRAKWPDDLAGLTASETAGDRMPPPITLPYLRFMDETEENNIAQYDERAGQPAEV